MVGDLIALVVDVRGASGNVNTGRRLRFLARHHIIVSIDVSLLDILSDHTI